MRARTLLILLIVAVLIVIGAYYLLNMRGDTASSPTPVPPTVAGEGEEGSVAESGEPGLPPPTPTPMVKTVTIEAPAERGGGVIVGSVDELISKLRDEFSQSTGILLQSDA